MSMVNTSQVFVGTLMLGLLAQLYCAARALFNTSGTPVDWGVFPQEEGAVISGIMASSVLLQ